MSNLMDMGILQSVNRMQVGNVLLVICCLIYLVWWAVAFHPEKKGPAALKVILFFVTFFAGLAGVVILFRGMGGLPDLQGLLSNLDIVIAGIVLYFLLLYLTKHFLHRQVTTELALITGWAVLQLCAVNGLYGADILQMLPAVLLELLILAAAVIGLVCYLAYYRLEPKKAFYDGMVPLLLFAGVMAVEILVVAFWGAG